MGLPHGGKKELALNTSELFYTITESAQGENEPVSEKDRSSVSRRCRNALKVRKHGHDLKAGGTLEARIL